MKTILLIDGENFKAKIKNIFAIYSKNKPTWSQYDFKKLFETTLKDFKIDQIIFYFAKIKRHPDTLEKSDLLIQEQRSIKLHLEKQGFLFEIGGMVTGHIQEDINKKEVLVFQEKGVDVKIAVDMVGMVCDNSVNQIILGSSDSDLIPAIKEIRKRGAKCIYYGFEDRINKGILYSCDRTILIRNNEVLECEKIQNTLNL